MSEDNVIAFQEPKANEDPLTALLCTGAKRLIQQAVEAELGELLTAHAAPGAGHDAPRRGIRLAP